MLVFALLPWRVVADSELPLLGENGVFSLNQEEQLGRGLYQKLKQQGYVVDDPLLSRYLQDIGESLLSRLDVRFRQYHFFLVKDGAVNAFAAPGGYIGVNIGLIGLTRNVDELASVLAHEIAHVRLKHSMQMIERAQNVNLATMVSLLAAILMSGQDPQMANAILFGGIAGGTQSMINYTRENEYEADRVGIETLKKSDYNPRAAADFMRLLQQREQTGGIAGIEYLRTHPIGGNRIAEIVNRLQDVQPKSPVALHYLEFRDYLFYQYPQAARAFAQATKSPFSQALELMRNGRYIQSERQLRDLQKRNPDSVWLNYALAQNLVFQDRLDEAEEIYRKTLLIYPDDLALTLQLTGLLVQQGRVQQALTLALPVFRKYREMPSVYPLQVEIYSKLKHPLKKRLAEANYHWYNGNLDLAVKQYKALLREGGLEVAEETEMQEKLAEAEASPAL